MIQKNNTYILTVNDFVLICKYFGVNINTTTVKMQPSLTFSEYRFYDTYTNGMLFSFYDHDGMFRVPKNSKEFYEIHISKVLTKNPDMPPVEMLHLIKKNAHTLTSEIKRKVRNTKNKLSK